MKKKKDRSREGGGKYGMKEGIIKRAEEERRI